jgi:hypothetical protein
VRAWIADLEAASRRAPDWHEPRDLLESSRSSLASRDHTHASSLNRQGPFTFRICAGLRHSAAKSRGLPALARHDSLPGEEDVTCGDRRRT